MKEESRIVEETRQKIASGELTYDQMKEKLIAAINKEYEKEGEPNIELINACEELLAELATDGQPLPESHQEKYGEVIRQNIQVSHHARNRVGFVKRLAVSLVVLVLLLGGGQVFLHREWFEHGTTDDEQQHIVQGCAVDPGLVANAIAMENRDTKILTTTDYNEAKAFLGFELPLSILLDDWNIDKYFIAIQPSYIRCSLRFISNSNKDHFVLQLLFFSSVQDAFVTYEQEREGEKCLINGVEVYQNQNEEKNAMMWVQENCMYYLHGRLTRNQLTEIFKQFEGG